MPEGLGHCLAGSRRHNPLKSSTALDHIPAHACTFTVSQPSKIMQGSALAASGKALEIFILVCRAPYQFLGTAGPAQPLWGAWLLESTPGGWRMPEGQQLHPRASLRLVQTPRAGTTLAGSRRGQEARESPGEIGSKNDFTQKAFSQPWWAGAGTAPSMRLLRGRSTARSCSAPIRTPQHHLPAPQHRMGPQFLWSHQPAAQPSRLAGCCPGRSICKQVENRPHFFFSFKPLPVL